MNRRIEWPNELASGITAGSSTAVAGSLAVALSGLWTPLLVAVCGMVWVWLTLFSRLVPPVLLMAWHGTAAAMWAWVTVFHAPTLVVPAVAHLWIMLGYAHLLFSDQERRIK